MEKPGFQLGAYSVTARLGVGGMGEVWLATKGHENFVLKTLLPHLADDPRMLEMFIKEARVASLVKGPNVVQMFEHGEAQGQHFLVLEYVDGVSLDRLLSRFPVLPPALAAYVASQACAGLSAIHEQTGMTVVHRDISPSNLLVSNSGVVKVADFGIAKTYTTDPGGTTTVGTTKGKIAFMSPEQAKGQHVDARTDVFALGVSMFQMLCGDLPYNETKNDYEMLAQVVYGRRKALAELAPKTPAALATIVDKAMTLEVEARWQTARAMRDALEVFLGGFDTQAAAEELGGRVRACGQVSVAKRPRFETAPAKGRVAAPVITVDEDVGPPMRVSDSDLVAMTPSDRVQVPAGAEGPVPLGVSAVAPTAPERPPREHPGRRVGLAAGLAALAALAVVGGIRLLEPREASTPPTPVTPPAAPEPPERGVTPFVPGGPPVVRPLAPPPAAPVEAPDAVPNAGLAEGGRDRPPVAQAPRAKVMLETTPACDVFVGKRKVGRSPVELMVGAEPLTVRLVSETEGINLDYSVAAKRGEPAKHFDVPRANVDLRVSPWAEVTLDGRALGMTPLKPLGLYAGRHSMDLVNGDLQVRRHVDFELAPGEVRTIREKMEP